ncbi:MAG TPA: phytoene/squalene synthase family protein [Polyangia bacterium]|nr:phytoene/squalene synthase family protein [Polyangia bacterium]
MRDAERAAHAALAAGSKSFALAGKLLPRRHRDDAAVLYAWCRRCDDAIDLAPPAERPAALQRMRDELDAVYAGAPIADPTLAAFAGVVRRCKIPRRYPAGLLDGFQMDVDGVRYATVSELLGYAYRVAGTVGVMMAHVMGASGTEPLRRAAHLGMAMQLTNICRDVDEDWRNGRVYLPEELLGSAPVPSAAPGLDPTAAAGAMACLLARARGLYESGEGGLEALRFRCAGAIRAAGLIYADIGRLIAARGYDIRRGRAVVSRGRKLWLVARAFAVEAALRTWRAVARVPEALP